MMTSQERKEELIAQAKARIDAIVAKYQKTDKKKTLSVKPN